MKNNFFKVYKEFKSEFKNFVIDKKTRITKNIKLKSFNSIKINLGCGEKLKKGYINIDLNKLADFRLDLRKKLPFKNNSIDFIYSKHFFEHIDYLDSTAINCLKDYLRVLKKGGEMRMVIPDMEKVFKAYVNKDLRFFDLIDIELVVPQSKEYSSVIDYVNYGIYQFGQHRYCYDFEKICLLLKSVGFKNIIKDKFDPDIDSDTEIRKRYSLYVKAIK